MKKVYEIIGEIIKTVQYIEYNLAEFIRYQEILDIFEDGEVVPSELFQATEEGSLQQLLIETSPCVHNYGIASQADRKYNGNAAFQEDACRNQTSCDPFCHHADRVD